jgi:regulator of PEP synthase PpsR (kinase-PPPase family)
VIELLCHVVNLRKGVLMSDSLPTTLGEIARVALAQFAVSPESVTHVSVMTSHGHEQRMSRTGATLWASLEPDGR